MKRFLALVVAVGLVVGAWYVYEARTADDGDGGGGGSATPSGDAPTLICATEVREACKKLDDVLITAVEEPGITFDRLAAGEPLGADAWLVSQPWPDMAAALDLPVAGISDVLARAPVVVVVPARRPADLVCPQGVVWECVATFAFGSSNFAHGNRNTTGGLLVRHGLASGLIGRTDYASNDFEFTDDFATTYASIEDGVADATTGQPRNLVNTIQTATGTYSAVGVLGSDAIDLNDRFEAVTPTPEITADMVLAGRPGRFDLEKIRNSLFTTGWLRSGDKRLAETNGLPNPGVMVALRALSR